MATIQDVSEMAQVSKATVSRVINEKGGVSRETIERVHSAMQALNFQPNTFAQSLATNRSNAIGVVFCQLYSSYFGRVLEGIEEVVEGAGMHVIASSGHESQDRERAAVNFLMNRRCDGMILHVETIPDEEILKLAAGKVPLIILNRYIDELSDRLVYLDNEAGGQLATQFLIEKGHTRIACISGSQASYDGRARFAGYRLALEQAGLPFDQSLVLAGDFSVQGGYKTTQRLLSRNLDFTALFIGNDDMAVGAKSAIYEAGLRVPEDISLIGFDNHPFAEFLNPKLTTIDQPGLEMGRSAASLLLKSLNGGSSSNIKNVFQPQLIERDSVADLRLHQ